MDQTTFERLSTTQLAVLWLIADHSRGAVAKALGMGSVETVKTHLAAIQVRLNGVDRDEASRALRGLIPHPPPWVTPPWGMEAPAVRGPLPQSVREERASFVGFATEPLEPAKGGARFAALTSADRIGMIATAALKIAQALLIMLAVCAAASIVLGALFKVPFHP